MATRQSTMNASGRAGKARLLPQGTGDFFKRRTIEGFGLAVGLIGLLVFVACLTYNPADPSANRAGAGPGHQPPGRAGGDPVRHPDPVAGTRRFSPDPHPAGLGLAHPARARAAPLVAAPGAAAARPDRTRRGARHPAAARRLAAGDHAGRVRRPAPAGSQRRFSGDRQDGQRPDRAGARSGSFCLCHRAALWRVAQPGRRRDARSASGPAKVSRPPPIRAETAVAKGRTWRENREAARSEPTLETTTIESSRVQIGPAGDVAGARRAGRTHGQGRYPGRARQVQGQTQQARQGGGAAHPRSGPDGRQLRGAAAFSHGQCRRSAPRTSP